MIRITINHYTYYLFLYLIIQPMFLSSASNNPISTFLTTTNNLRTATTTINFPFSKEPEIENLFCEKKLLQIFIANLKLDIEAKKSSLQIFNNEENSNLLKSNEKRLKNLRYLQNSLTTTVKEIENELKKIEAELENTCEIITNITLNPENKKTTEAPNNLQSILSDSKEKSDCQLILLQSKRKYENALQLITQAIINEQNVLEGRLENIDSFQKFKQNCSDRLSKLQKKHASKNIQIDTKAVEVTDTTDSILLQIKQFLCCCYKSS